jgi:hypothetical protein
MGGRTNGPVFTTIGVAVAAVISALSFLLIAIELDCPFFG